MKIQAIFPTIEDTQPFCMQLKSIQFLRAMAACLVVYVHCIGMEANFSLSAQQTFLYLRNFGCIGVDLFFVISGFIITFVAHRYCGVEAGWSFLKKRFLRINPVYYFASALYVMILFAKGLLSYDSLYLLGASSDTILIFPFVSNINLYLPFLVVSWTLAFEWFFYFLFLLAVLLNIKKKALFLIFLITVLASIGYYFKPRDARLLTITNPILMEFLLGVIICWLFIKSTPIPRSVAQTALLLGLGCYVVLIIFGYGDVWHYNNVLTAKLSMQRFVAWGIPSSFIVLACVYLEKMGTFNSLWNNKIIQLIGNGSYSIYISHVSVFALLKPVFRQLTDVINADLVIWIIFISSIAGGIVFYYVIERPLIAAAKNEKKKERQVVTFPSSP